MDTMEFEWDEAKSDACLAERGFDFAYSARVFLDPRRVEEPDERYEYGEARYRVYGEIDGRLFVVVYTPRGGRLRLISARRANKREVQLHGASAGRAEPGRNNDPSGQAPKEEDHGADRS